MKEQCWGPHMCVCTEVMGGNLLRMFCIVIYLHILAAIFFNFYFFHFEVRCGQVWWPILGIYALQLTHPSAHTHREHTPGAVGSQCCGTRGAVGGTVPCSRVSPLSWYWRWRECSLFTPPTDNSCRARDSNLQPRVTSPTRYPLGHDCPVFLYVFFIKHLI